MEIFNKYIHERHWSINNRYFQSLKQFFAWRDVDTCAPRKAVQSWRQYALHTFNLPYLPNYKPILFYSEPCGLYGCAAIPWISSLQQHAKHFGTFYEHARFTSNADWKSTDGTSQDHSAATALTDGMLWNMMHVLNCIYNQGTSLFQTFK